MSNGKHPCKHHVSIIQWPYFGSVTDQKLSDMPFASRQHLVNALLSLLPEQASPVISVKPDQPRPTPIRPNGNRNKAVGSTYDPSMVFMLELATILTSRDSESISSMGEVVSDALQTVVRDATNVHPLALARTIYYLLFMLDASQQHSFVRAPVVLHTISSYDQALLESAEREICQGLEICVRKPSPLKNEITNTPDFWLILRSLHNRPVVAGRVFEIVRSIVESKPGAGAVTADNYEAAVSLLNGLASAGSIGAAVEQQRDRRSTDQQRERKPTKGEKTGPKPGRKPTKEYDILRASMITLTNVV